MDNLDTLFTVVFVVVIVLFQLFGVVLSRLAKKGGSGQGKAAKSDGLVQVFKKLGREIQTAMEQQTHAGGSWPQEQPEKKETFVQTGKPRQPPFPVYENAGTPPPAVPPRTADEDLIADIRQGVLKEVEDNTAVTQTETTLMAYRVSDLRRAVIWAEILGPPKALREE